MQESSCTILKVSVAKRTAFNNQKPYVARGLLDNSEASTFCCKRVVALFGKLSLQEACFHTQEASVARMLLSSELFVASTVMVLFRKCSLQEGCCAILKVSVCSRIAVLVYW